jgi:outer membrane protein assembly factor BamB
MYGRLYAIDASTGVEIWRSSIERPANRDRYNLEEYTPVVYSDKVFYKSPGKVSCLNAADGAPIWNTSDDLSYARFQPAVANGKVFIMPYVPRSNGVYKFQCLNASTGSSIWTSTIKTESYGESSATVAGGKIFFGTAEGKLWCLDENTGSEIWSFQGPEEEAFHDPAIADGTVFASCGWNVHGISDPVAGGVYAFGEKYRTNLTLSLDSETSLLGFKVTLSGTLESNGAAIGGASVLLSYSVTGGESWVDVTAAETAADGSYSAVWIPSATGTYLVRATWAQYSAYDKAVYSKGESLRMLSVRNFDEQNVFSVSSNSTLSALAFDSANRELSFTVAGENGTTGFVEVSVAKSLVANVADLRVFLDGASLDYIVESNGDSWVLFFVYVHSTHNVTVNLGAGASIIWLIATVVGAVVVGAFLLFYFKRGEK